MWNKLTQISAFSVHIAHNYRPTYSVLRMMFSSYFYFGMTWTVTDKLFGKNMLLDLFIATHDLMSFIKMYFCLKTSTSSGVQICRYFLKDIEIIKKTYWRMRYVTCDKVDVWHYMFRTDNGIVCIFH